jgi:phage tail sheath protein FI
MPTQVSAGVITNEIDLTTIVPSVSTTEGAFAGVFSWGPVEDTDLVGSEDELRLRYGPPTDGNFETWFSAANFLAYGNKLYISRADANSFNAIGGASYGANTVSTTRIKNREDFELNGGVAANSGTSYVIAKFPGARGNSLRVSQCDSKDQFSSLLAASANVTGVSVAFSFAVGSNVATLSVTAGANNLSDASNTATTILNNLSVGDFVKAGNTAIGSQFIKVSAVSQPTTANTTTVTAKITLSSRYTLSSNVTQSSVNRYWEFYNLVDRAPGTSSFVKARGGSGDEVHVVVVDDDGFFTGTKNAVLEVYHGLSRAKDAEGTQGGSNYYRQVINQGSPYIWYVYDRAGSLSATSFTVTPVTTPQPLNLPLVGGADGLDEQTIDVGDLARAYDKYRSTESIDISLIVAGKARGGLFDAQMANYLIDNIAEYRKDCVVFISPRREAVVQNFNPNEEDVVAFRNQLRSSSYGVLDSGYKYQYDKYNDLYRWVPLNGDIAGLCVRTDDTRDPWWSPAGFNRGNIKNVVKLSFNPDKSRRDILYPNGINPVVTFPGNGTILYGDKTLLAQSSAFDRINVRRLFIVLEKAIAKAAKYTLFEFNDTFTRAQFRNMVEPYLRDVMGRRGIYDFKVVCDETNNTPEVIDRNEFIGDIYIKPARSISYISLNFVAVRTGVEFSEVVGKF